MTRELNTDGTVMLRTARDLACEARMQRTLEARWKIKLHRYPDLYALDWWAERDRRVTAFLEGKGYNFSSEQFPRYYLALRKWTALQLNCVGTGLPGCFVCGWTDCLTFIDIQQVDPRQCEVGGRRDRGLPNDIEPIIMVPANEWTRVDYLDEGGI